MYQTWQQWSAAARPNDAGYVQPTTGAIGSMSATPGSGQWQTQAAGYNQYAVPPNMQQQQWRWDQGTWGNQGQYNYANMAIGAVGQQLRPQYPQIPVTGSYPAGQAYQAVQNYQTTTAGAVWTADGFQSGQNVGFSGEAQGNAEEKQPPPPPPPAEENATKVNDKGSEAGENAEQPKEELAPKDDAELEKMNQLRAQAQQWKSQQQQTPAWSFPPPSIPPPAPIPTPAPTPAPAIAPTSAPVQGQWMPGSWQQGSWGQGQWGQQWAQTWGQQGSQTWRPEGDQQQKSIEQQNWQRPQEVQQPQQQQQQQTVEQNTQQQPGSQRDFDREEEEFEHQFSEWEKQFEKWKEQNMSHPDKEAFAGYEKQWQEWRMQLLQRRDQMRRLKAERQAAEAAAAATSVATPPVSNESSEMFQKSSDQVTSSKEQEQTPTSQADTSQPSVENAATPSNEHGLFQTGAENTNSGSQPDVTSGQQIPGLDHLQEDQISASQPTSLTTTLSSTSDPSSQGPPIFPDQSKNFFPNQFPMQNHQMLAQTQQPMMQPQTMPLPPHLLQHQFPPPRQPPPPPAVHLRKDRNEPAKALLPDPPGYKMSQDQKRPLLSTPPPVGQGPMPRGASAGLLPLPPPGSRIGATPNRTPTPSDFTSPNSLGLSHPGQVGEPNEDPNMIVEGSQEQQFAQQLPLAQNKDDRFKLGQMRKDVSKEEETRFQKAAELLQSNADAFGNREPYMSQVGIEESQDNMRDNWNFGGDRGRGRSRGIDRDHIRSRGRGRGRGRGTRWSDDTDDDEGRRSFGVGRDNMLPRDESGDKRREVFGEKTDQSSGFEERDKAEWDMNQPPPHDRMDLGSQPLLDTQFRSEGYPPDEYRDNFMYKDEERYSSGRPDERFPSGSMPQEGFPSADEFPPGAPRANEEFPLGPHDDFAADSTQVHGFPSGSLQPNENFPPFKGEGFPPGPFKGDGFAPGPFKGEGFPPGPLNEEQFPEHDERFPGFQFEGERFSHDVFPDGQRFPPAGPRDNDRFPYDPQFEDGRFPPDVNPEGRKFPPGPRSKGERFPGQFHENERFPHISEEFPISSKDGDRFPRGSLLNRERFPSGQLHKGDQFGPGGIRDIDRFPQGFLPDGEKIPLGPPFEEDFPHGPPFDEERFPHGERFPPHEGDRFMMREERFPPGRFREDRFGPNNFPPEELMGRPGIPPGDRPFLGEEFHGRDFPLNDLDRFRFGYPDDRFPHRFPDERDRGPFPEPGFCPPGRRPPFQDRGNGDRFGEPPDNIRFKTIDYTHRPAVSVLGEEFSRKYDAFDYRFGCDLMSYRAAPPSPPAPW